MDAPACNAGIKDSLVGAKKLLQSPGRTPLSTGSESGSAAGSRCLVVQSAAIRVTPCSCVVAVTQWLMCTKLELSCRRPRFRFRF